MAFKLGHTGYGKSLIFQMIPVISDYLQDKQIGSSVAVVISPLKALMKDQVEYLNSHTAISAVALTDMSEKQEDEVLRLIEEGVHSLVYTSSETFLDTKRWRNLASSAMFRDDCVALVVDEAPCIVQW